MAFKRDFAVAVWLTDIIFHDYDCDSVLVWPRRAFGLSWNQHLHYTKQNKRMKFIVWLSSV